MTTQLKEPPLFLDWRPVPDCPTQYEVSTQGRIRHIQSGRLVKLEPGKGSYLRFACRPLGLGRVMKRTQVHRAVAQAFLENPENKPCVNHIDNNRSNNDVQNLEWCTYSENALHTANQGRTVSKFTIWDIWHGRSWRWL